MIHVSNLTKYYGDYAAVQDVSFDVPKGRVVGFLGPNGAGKSTTMRILAGYLTATSGYASINGLDVFSDSVEVRRQIGYMPESCPLYSEMRVSEYLHFRAGLKGIYGSVRRKRMDFVLKRCWLDDVRRQIIGTLSKGYRQRVGLADALLANPPVLILDEPTAGLDPTQIRSTRDLIRELGQEHTILLSTHILSEVEMACDSVIIIHRGRVAVQSSLKNLHKKAGGECLVVIVEGAADPAFFQYLPGVETYTAIPESDSRYQLRITSPNLSAVASEVCSFAVKNHWQVVEVRHDRPTLEDLFVEITQEEPA